MNEWIHRILYVLNNHNLRTMAHAVNGAVCFCLMLCRALCCVHFFCSLSLSLASLFLPFSLAIQLSFFHPYFMHKIDLIARLYTFLLLCHPRCHRTILLLVEFFSPHMCLSLHSQFLAIPLLFLLFHLAWKCIYEKRLWAKHGYAKDVRVPLLL